MTEKITYTEITDATFEQEVMQANLPVLLDFGAAWCGPCKVMFPIIEELASEFAGKAKITKVDVDTNPQTTVKYGIRNLPTMLILQNGVVVEKLIGAVTKRTLADKLSLYV